MGEDRVGQRGRAASATGPKPAHREEGASLVEFALLAPVLMSLLLGMFTGGLAYNRKISITSAVREGARFGATLACDATCVATTPSTTWTTQVTQRVVDASGGELAAGNVCVWLGTASGTTNCGLTDPVGAAGTMIVKVSASRSARIEYVFASQSLTLKASTANRYERSSTYGVAS